MITNKQQYNYILKTIAAMFAEAVATTHKIILYNPDYNNLTVTIKENKRRPVVLRPKLQVLIILSPLMPPFQSRVHVTNAD